MSGHITYIHRGHSYSEYIVHMLRRHYGASLNIHIFSMILAFLLATKINTITLVPVWRRGYCTAGYTAMASSETRF